MPLKKSSATWAETGAAPNANNYANMEGLSAADDRVRYGGGDDSDSDSGSPRPSMITAMMNSGNGCS